MTEPMSSSTAANNEASTGGETGSGLLAPPGRTDGEMDWVASTGRSGDIVSGVCWAAG